MLITNMYAPWSEFLVKLSTLYPTSEVLPNSGALNDEVYCVIRMCTPPPPTSILCPPAVVYMENVPSSSHSLCLLV